MKTVRILSLLTAGSAFYLLIAGAQVNAYQAALSVPDWPLSYGRLLAPVWPGNVFYEQHHRATAATTLLLFVALAIALSRAGRGAGLAAARQMARYAGATLAIQIVLGGLVVLWLAPPWLGAIHAVVAIGTVVLLAAVALLIWDQAASPMTSPALDRIRRRARIALWLVAVQLVFGAVTRHPPLGELTFVTTLMAHLLNGVIATMFLVLLASSMIRMPKIDRLRRWGWLLLAAVLAQVAVGAWVFVIAPEPFEEALAPPAGFAAAHAAHIVLAAAIATCLVAPLLRDRPWHHRAARGLVVCLLGISFTPVATASTESELNSRWRGAWTVVAVETLSDCGGNYTNNEVSERRVSSKGDYRFARGELATVYKINLKRKQVEVLVNLAEPILVERREGPFTLYDALECKVELQIKLPRETDSRTTRQIDRVIAELLERHDGMASARSSANWNGRLRDPLPADYEETLADYERWRIDQTNAEIAATIEHHVEEAARLVDRLDDDAAYLAGFAEGVDRGRDSGLDKDCQRLLSMAPSSFVKSGSKKDERAFREGYRDGQELVFYLEVARRLPRCFLAPATR